MQTTESLAPAQNGHLLALAFEGKSVRVLERDGDPWFVANDVGDALGLVDVKFAVHKLEDDQKGCLGSNQLPGLRADTSLVSESGLYELIFRSSKPEAKRFRKWVTGEVLPQIRKTGGYARQDTAARPGMSKLEDALVDLAREHDLRIGDLESVMRPGTDWISIMEWTEIRYGVRLGNGRIAFLARLSLAESAMSRQPVGEQRGQGFSRRTFAPVVLEKVIPPRMEAWAKRDAQKGEPQP